MTLTKKELTEKKTNPFIMIFNNSDSSWHVYLGYELLFMGLKAECQKYIEQIENLRTKL